MTAMSDEGEEKMRCMTPLRPMFGEGFIAPPPFFSPKMVLERLGIPQAAHKEMELLRERSMAFMTGEGPGPERPFSEEYPALASYIKKEEHHNGM